MADFKEIEAVAVELARLAGTEIQTALGGILAVTYKSGGDTGEISLRDPVSEVDHRVETLIRARLADRFPDHGILGEEGEDSLAHADFIWAVDPVDGTTNFVNGFPVFAGSIGVLYKGEPVVGAVWCAATHALRPGVYHACRGGKLHFDNELLDRQPNPAVRRHLAGEPREMGETEFPWEVRTTGSAAAECAFVAAGLMRVARFARPNVWDVAGGVALVQAAGGHVVFHDGGHWHEFSLFVGPKGPTDLRAWHKPLVIGDASAIKLMTGATRH
jgi:myo-inositol-1(or 4)-monophosphatase